MVFFSYKKHRKYRYENKTKMFKRVNTFEKDDGV
jgi:hypothetical protein